MTAARSAEAPITNGVPICRLFGCLVRIATTSGGHSAGPGAESGAPAIRSFRATAPITRAVLTTYCVAARRTIPARTRADEPQTPPSGTTRRKRRAARPTERAIPPELKIRFRQVPPLRADDE